VIRGTADNILSRPDSGAIEQIVNQIHPDRATPVQIDDMTHEQYHYLVAQYLRERNLQCRDR
jgi:hypothetical protein